MKTPLLQGDYQVWVLYNGNPQRRIADRLTLKEAQDRVTLEGKLSHMSSRELAICCRDTGRFLHF